MNPAASAKPTLLLVDDTPSNLRLLCDALAPEYELLIATNGDKALEIASRAPVLDAILLDIMMPGMDGYEVCRRLKMLSRVQDVPVLFLTAANSEQSEEIGFGVGASDYIAKPFCVPVLKARLHAQVEWRRRAVMLEQLALIDPLTGLGNRRRFDQALDNEWKRALRQQTPLGLMIIDVDNFKAFNDRYGHGVGDQVLRFVGDSLRSVVKRPSDQLVRYAGDEFAVLLPDTTEAGARALAEHLVQVVHEPQQPLDLVGEALGVSVSVGFCAVIPDGRREPADLVRLADAALFEAKRQGRNRACSASVRD